METATTLAIIILFIAVLILIYYYLQATNHLLYQKIHMKASDISTKIEQEEHVSDLSGKFSDFSEKVKDKVQDDDADDEERISKTDQISNKIDQFINEQSEQVIEDWDLATNKDLDEIIDKFNLFEDDFNSYKKSNDLRVEDLEKRVNSIDDKINDIENEDE